MKMRMRMICVIVETHIRLQKATRVTPMPRSHSISSTSLCYINPDLVACNNVGKDQLLCLPDACETMHMVYEGEK